MGEINLEIGARTKPIINELDNKFTTEKNSIFLDKRFWGKYIKPKKTSLFKRIFLGKKDKNLGNTQADTQALPFAKDSTGLLVSKDMFCAQGYLTQKPNFFSTRENVGDLKLIAKEWFRVTKPGGLAIAIEIATPSKDLLGMLDYAFFEAGFARTNDDVYRNDEISQIFKKNSSYSKQEYQTPNAFAVIYQKPFERRYFILENSCSDKDLN